MKTLESRRGARSDRDREAAYQERQARRQAMHRGEPSPVAATSPASVAPSPMPVAPARQPLALPQAQPHRARPAHLARPTLPRREGPRRSLILIPFLILISLAAIALAGYALSKAPSTSNVNTQITALQAQLAQARHQITSLQSQIATSATTRNVKQVNRNLAGLKKSVGGVQNAIAPLRAELSSLRVCLPQLQTEITGVAAHARQHGVTTVGLSPECSSFLGGQTTASAG